MKILRIPEQNTPAPALSQLFGDDEKKWERVMMEMKKINSRLVSLKTKDLKGLEDNQAQLQQSQGEILSQIQNLQSLIPNIQGVVEQSNAAMGRQVSGFSAKLAELELALKAELQQNNKSQAEAINNLNVVVSAKVDGMAAKVDTMKSQVNVMKSAFLTLIFGLWAVVVQKQLTHHRWNMGKYLDGEYLVDTAG